MGVVGPSHENGITVKVTSYVFMRFLILVLPFILFYSFEAVVSSCWEIPTGVISIQNENRT